MKRSIDTLVAALCRSSCRRPWAWILASLLLTVPAAWSLSRLGLDTDLIRLLPRHTRAAEATRELDGVVGGTSYFALIIEGEPRERLHTALRETVARVRDLEGVGAVEYTHPVGFIERYRYLLIPAYYLEAIREEVLDWQAEASPFFADLGADEEAEPTYLEEEDRKEIEDRLERYGSLPRYHSSADGRLVGIFVRPARGVTSLGATRRLFARLQKVADDIEGRHGVRTGVSGSMRNKIDEYDLIIADLSRSGLVAGSLIVLTLLVAFRSPIMAALPLIPLAAGLVWGFGLVPWTVGDLNMISAFLLLIVFGMGIDYSIHLLKRFRLEIAVRPLEPALVQTYESTGRGVGVSGLTTGLALLVLAVSDFRGFSEFGIVGGLSVLTVLAAMYVVFPATLVLAHRHGLVRPGAPRLGVGLVPGRWLTTAGIVLTLVAAVVAFRGLSFDYDFSNMSARTDDLPESRAAKEMQHRVYTTTRSPAAIFVADDLEALDRALAVVETARRRPGSAIGRAASIRDLAPTPAAAAERRELIEQIRGELSGRWTRRVEDPRHRRWIEDLRSWSMPATTPAVGELPESLRSGLLSRESTARPLLAIYPAVERKDGRNAMAFTRELYSLELPAGVRGPLGETPVFAEILWLVLGEGPWLVAATFLGVGLLVLAAQRSWRQTLWILLPLGAGMILTLGAMALWELRLNFFNVVVLPALLGLGIDDGVHYYRRWRELGGDTAATSREMLVPLTVTSATTMMGYSGMLFARHQGLESIGVAACLGLGIIWATSLFLLPALLDWLHPRPEPAPQESAPVRLAAEEPG